MNATNALTLSIVSLLLSGLSYYSTAETIKVPVGSQGDKIINIDRPMIGMNKQQVETIFGYPNDKTTPVGEPPISQWEYKNYVVYFEYNSVIHTVLKYTGKNVSE